MTFGNGLFVLVLGRFIAGLASGISTVLVPLFLSEIAPKKVRGSVGKQSSPFTMFFYSEYS